MAKCFNFFYFIYQGYHCSWIMGAINIDKIIWFEGSILEKRWTLFVPNCFATPLCLGLLCAHIFVCYFNLLKQFSILINTILIQHYLLDANFTCFGIIQRVTRKKKETKLTMEDYDSNIHHQENQDESWSKIKIPNRWTKLQIRYIVEINRVNIEYP